MDGSTLGIALFSIVALILPVMALVGRKIPASRLLGMAALWVLVFAAGWIALRAVGY